jgi:hypothetical protein
MLSQKQQKQITAYTNCEHVSCKGGRRPWFRHCLKITVSQPCTVKQLINQLHGTEHLLVEKLTVAPFYAKSSFITAYTTSSQRVSKLSDKHPVNISTRPVSLDIHFNDKICKVKVQCPRISEHQPLHSIQSLFHTRAGLQLFHFFLPSYQNVTVLHYNVFTKVPHSQTSNWLLVD